MTISILEPDWAEVREHVSKYVDSQMTPVERYKLQQAIEDIYDINPLESSQLIEEAKGDELREPDPEHFAFNPSAFNNDSDENGTAQEPDLCKRTLGDIDGAGVADDNTEVPPYLKTLTSWTVWFPSYDKNPREPWSNTLGPGKWKSGDAPALVSYEKASRWAENDVYLDRVSRMTPPAELNYLSDNAPSHTPEEILTELVLLGSEDPPLVVLDLDNVRNPKDGSLHPDAVDIIERCGAWAEISTSGSGVHVIVSGEIPEDFSVELDTEVWPGNDVDERPEAEVYHKDRPLALTGNQLSGTPDTISRAQDVLDDLYARYDEQREDVKISENSSVAEDIIGSDDVSPYFTYPTMKLMRRIGTAEFRQRGNSIKGPHPKHGSTNGNNFEVRHDKWYCHRKAHKNGGGALHLVAIMEEHLKCEHAGKGSLDRLSYTEFLKTCLAARDKYGFPDDAKPPYKAIRAIAIRRSTTSKNEAIGETEYTVCRTIYDNLSLSDL